MARAMRGFSYMMIAAFGCGIVALGVVTTRMLLGL